MLAELALALTLAQLHLRGVSGPAAEALEARVSSAARAIDARLATGGPIEVVVEPSLESFAQAGGRGRRAAAVAVDGRLVLPPWEVLQQLEDLDAVLRHELVHLRLGTADGHRVPRWLFEGLACELSAEELPDAGALPDSEAALQRLDGRLLHPPDLEALGRDYAAARALVRRVGAARLLAAWPALRAAPRPLAVELEGVSLSHRLFGTGGPGR
jgi:hypothetical protein